MFAYINSHKVQIGIILTFVITGLGSITSLVSPQVAVVIGFVLSGLTAIGHTYNIITGVK